MGATKKPYRPPAITSRPILVPSIFAVTPPPPRPGPKPPGHP